MLEIKGKFNKAIVNQDTIEEYAIAKIKQILDNKIFASSKIRVMCDVHPGKYGLIGLTMTLDGYVIPNLVGVDIGCGITAIKIKNKSLELSKLDKIIKENIPSGFKICSKEHRFANTINLKQLHCYHVINENKAKLSLGTLGGGNHFIELNKGKDLYLVVHSGSRHLGYEVAKYYQDLGYRKLTNEGINVAYEDAYLTDNDYQRSLEDIQIVQEFASLNRRCIIDVISKEMKLKVIDTLETIHNYIEISANKTILRKGAISAKKGEKLIIPIHMKQGILICTGLGIEDMNNSAPHGSGRIYSRKAIKELYSVASFKKEMKGIYCSVISKETLDEAPFAYRQLQDIKKYIEYTVNIEEELKPIYSYKDIAK